MDIARLAELASTAVLVAAELPEEIATAAKDRLMAGGMSDVIVLAGRPLGAAIETQPAAA